MSRNVQLISLLVIVGLAGSLVTIVLTHLMSSRLPLKSRLSLKLPTNPMLRRPKRMMGWKSFGKRRMKSGVRLRSLTNLW